MCIITILYLSECKWAPIRVSMHIINISETQVKHTKRVSVYMYRKMAHKLYFLCRNATQSCMLVG